MEMWAFPCLIRSSLLHILAIREGARQYHACKMFALSLIDNVRSNATKKTLDRLGLSGLRLFYARFKAIWASVKNSTTCPLSVERHCCMSVLVCVGFGRSTHSNTWKRANFSQAHDIFNRITIKFHIFVVGVTWIRLVSVSPKSV